MRRKQLYAIILAGALATSSAPAAVFAAEGDVAAMAETSEEAPAEGDNAAADSAAEDTPAQDNTDAADTPADTPAQDDNTAAATEAPAQDNTAAATEAPAEPTQDQTTEETPEAEVTEAPEAGETASGVMITVGGVTTAYPDIQAAIDNAPEPTTDENGNVQIPVVEVTKDQSVSAPITVANGKRVSITATAAVTITRADGFTDEIFKVSDENSELALETEGDGASLTVDGMTASGTKSLVSVSSSASFEMYDGVTLTNNKTDANGGAITNDGGKLLLAGGTVTGNTGTKGGIYSNTSVCVQGGIKVTDNKNSQDATANLYVDLADVTDVAVKVTGALTDAAAIGYTDAAPVADKTVITIGKDDADQLLVTTDVFKTAVSKFTYDDSTNFTFADIADGADFVSLKKVTTPDKKAFEVTETGSVKWSNYTTATAHFKTTHACKWYYELIKADANVGTFSESKAKNSAAAGNVDVSVKNIPTGNYAIAVYVKSQSDNTVKTLKIVLNNRPATTFKVSRTKGTKVEWTDHNTATVYFTATHDCKWYSEIIKASATSVKYSDSKATNTAKATDTVSVVVKNIPDDDDYAVAILARSTQDTAVKTVKVSFVNTNRPAASTVTRKARTYSVTDNKVTGLESDMKFFPAKVYPFTVKEAGMSDEGPYVVGDERYAYLYWSTNSEGDNPQSKTQIMSKNGIEDAKEFAMYIFFQKYRFNGSEWVKVGSGPEYLKYSFESAGYTEEELKEYLQEAKDNGTVIPGYENYTGGGDSTDAELTATAAASEKDAGSKSKSAVSTADESPIGTMSALAALSLLAGGYIVVRKRKKEEL